MFGDAQDAQALGQFRLADSWKLLRRPPGRVSDAKLAAGAVAQTTWESAAAAIAMIPPQR
jgi:hypothetical protein